jgi:hypothetical protein
MTTNNLPEYDRNEAVRIAKAVKEDDIDLSDMPEFGGADPSLWKRRKARSVHFESRSVQSA